MQRLGLSAYVAGVVACLYQVTINARLRWIYHDIDGLERQIKLCKQYPGLEDSKNTVYYHGKDLALSQAILTFDQRRLDYDTLCRYSPYHRLYSLLNKTNLLSP